MVTVLRDTGISSRVSFVDAILSHLFHFRDLRFDHVNAVQGPGSHASGRVQTDRRDFRLFSPMKLRTSKLRIVFPHLFTGNFSFLLYHVLSWWYIVSVLVWFFGRFCPLLFLVPFREVLPPARVGKLFQPTGSSIPGRDSCSQLI